MKFPIVNPKEIDEAVEAMGFGGYLKVRLEYHFPVSDVMEFSKRIRDAKNDNELRNIRVGNLRTSWVCTIEEDKDRYLHEVSRLCRWLDDGVTVGDAIERNFGICCSIGVKFHCQHLHHEYRYEEQLRAYPVINPRRRGA